MILIKAGDHVLPEVYKYLGVHVKCSPAVPGTWTAAFAGCGCYETPIVEGFASENNANLFVEGLQRYIKTWTAGARPALTMECDFRVYEKDGRDPEPIVEKLIGMGERMTCSVDYTIQEFCDDLDDLRQRKTYVLGQDFQFIESYLASSECRPESQSVRQLAQALWQRLKEDQNSERTSKLGFTDEFLQSMGWVRA